MRGIVIIGSFLLMGVVYAATFGPTRHGYGYMGYGGPSHGPSWFYFSSVHTYPSVRHGSQYGPSVMGHGMHGGK